MNLNIRTATSADMAACEAIYAHHVCNGVASFDETPPPPGYLDEKRQGILDSNLPFLVLETQGELLGFAYCTSFRPRSAYARSAEDSVYLSPDHVGKGLAKPLLNALIQDCREKGYRTLVAVIGMDQDQDPETYPSVRAHSKAGFQWVGALPFIGSKFGRWLKTGYMTLDLEA